MDAFKPGCRILRNIITDMTNTDDDVQNRKKMVKYGVVI